MGSRAAVARSREAAPTRDLILDAAERRFAERGFAAVSMRQIAAEAGLKNQASLYHHFNNKRALYEAVLARGVAPIVGVVAESSRGFKAGGTVGIDRAQMDETLDRIVDYLEEHPHLPRLIQRAALDDSRYLRNAVSRLFGPLYAEGLQALGGAFRRWDPAELPHLAIGIYHLIFGYFADATLFAAVVQQDPRSASAVARQRKFLKAAVAQLLGTGAVRRRRT